MFEGASYAKTEFKDFVFAGQQLAGNSFIRAPEWTGAIGASYDFGNGLVIGGDANYTGASFSDVTNTAALENDDYWLVNLNASYALSDRAVVIAYVKNLYDEQYTVGRNAAGGGIAGIGPAGATVGAGRAFGVFFSTTFCSP